MFPDTQPFAAIAREARTDTKISRRKALSHIAFHAFVTFHDSLSSTAIQENTDISMPLPSRALTAGRLLCWLCSGCLADSGSGLSNWCLMPLQGPLACCSSTVLTSCCVICSHQCAAAAPAALPTSCQLPTVTQLLLLLNVDSAGSAWRMRSMCSRQ
jgi:hypothetical protein